MTTYINLYGGPGAGKSTTAADLFSRLKKAGARAELVTEFAKDLTYEGGDLDNQLMILAEQDKRQRRLQGAVDFVITDSPLPIQIVYGKGIYQGPELRAFIYALYATYDNINVLLRRTKEYQTHGRSQTEEEARKLDEQIAALNVDWHVLLNGDDQAGKRLAYMLAYSGHRHPRVIELPGE